MLTLYASKWSRAFIPYWLLGELDVPYRVEDRDLQSRRHKQADYLKINPMGKVPAIDDDGDIVTENPAICIYLADRYGYGTLAPRIEEPDRGRYLRWTVFATAVFEPAAYLPDAGEEGASGVGWGRKADMLRALESALSPGPYILGDRFSAADVMLGGLLSIALFNKRVTPTALLAAYNERIAARPAYQAALRLNGWG
jgi:glutathione S-transferase